MLLAKMQGGAPDPRTQPLQLQQAGSGGHPGAHLLRFSEQAKAAHHLQAGADAAVAASILQLGRLHSESRAVCRQASAPPRSCPEMTWLQLRGMIPSGWLAMAKVCCASAVSRGALHLVSACSGHMQLQQLCCQIETEARPLCWPPMCCRAAILQWHTGRQ